MILRLFPYLIVISIAITSCSGSKKYFKAAIKLEEQGLVSDASEYYYESLNRKHSNTKARMKLKEVGQKHINNLSSQFFREYNTQQYENCIETFDRLKSFVLKSFILNVELNYPKAYENDYNKSLEYYLNKHYIEATDAVNQKDFELALKSISKIKKYNPTYKKTQELEVTSRCEPLYLLAVKEMEAKSYVSARIYLSQINDISFYKDSKDLFDLVNELLKKSYIIFKPTKSLEKDIEEQLYDSFNEIASKNTGKAKLINNTPFVNFPEINDNNLAANLDLIQSIRKATGADYFYFFDVLNKREIEMPQTSTSNFCYEKFTIKKDTTFVTIYQKTPYNQIKAQRSYSYDFKYKIIDAISNQVVATKTENCFSVNQLDYYEFVKSGRLVKSIYTPTYNTNNYLPYDPTVVPRINQYNPSSWRNGFNNVKELKSFATLKSETDQKVSTVFSSTLSNYIIK